MPKLTVNNFNLVHTLECGQTFRVRKIADWYYVNTRDKFFKVKQKGSRLEFYGVKEDFLIHFFSLDEPLEQILAEINKDKHKRVNEMLKKFTKERIKDLMDRVIEKLEKMFDQIDK